MIVFVWIEHSENEIITQSGLFENEIGSDVVQDRVQKTEQLQEYQMHKPGATETLQIVSVCWMQALQVQPRF